MGCGTCRKKPAVAAPARIRHVVDHRVRSRLLRAEMEGNACGSVTRGTAMSEISRRMTCRVALEYFEADHDDAARGEGVVVGRRVNDNRWRLRCSHWGQSQQNKGSAH
jgi:hypothetical protein